MIYIAIISYNNKGTESVKEKLQMFGCSHWLIIKMLSVAALKWKANGKPLEDEASPEISQMCLALAGPLSLPEHPVTAKTIAHILSKIPNHFLLWSLKQLYIFNVNTVS